MSSILFVIFTINIINVLIVPLADLLNFSIVQQANAALSNLLAQSTNSGFAQRI